MKCPACKGKGELDYKEDHGATLLISSSSKDKKQRMKFVYKIRRTSDNLYSCGKCNPEFNKNGKVWRSIGALKNHLGQFKKIPEIWEVLEFPVLPLNANRIFKAKEFEKQDRFYSENLDSRHFKGE